MPTESPILEVALDEFQKIKKLADKFLTDPRTVEVARPATANVNIEQRLVEVRSDRKREMLRELLRADEVRNAIVFANRKTTVRELATSLGRAHFHVGQIHGDMEQPARIAELERFKKDEINILVASDVAARGLDIKGVSHVFNFDAPWHPDDYVHRIGRTGRAGAKGRAFTLVSPSDDEAVDNIQKLTGYQIPVHGGEGGAPQRATDGDADEREPRRGRRAGAKAAKEPKRAVEKPAKAPKKDAGRKPAPRSRHDDDDGPDDGWNGPMPGFLSVGFGS